MRRITSADVVVNVDTIPGMEPVFGNQRIEIVECDRCGRRIESRHRPPDS